MAKTIEISQKTTLSPDQVRQAVTDVVTELMDKYTLSGGWQGARTYVISGQGIFGDLKIRDGSVDVKITVSGVLCPFVQMIEDSVKKKLATHLAP